MLGRLLLSVVGLIIAAGLLLPLYAPEGQGAGPAPAGAALLVAVAMTADCPKCGTVAAGDTICQPACPCSHALTPADDTAEDVAGEIIYLVVQPGPSDRLPEPQPSPPRLPAI